MVRASFLLRARPDSAPPPPYEFRELFLAMLPLCAANSRETKSILWFSRPTEASFSPYRSFPFSRIREYVRFRTRSPRFRLTFDLERIGERTSRKCSDRTRVSIPIYRSRKRLCATRYSFPRWWAGVGWTRREFQSVDASALKQSYASVALKIFPVGTFFASFRSLFAVSGSSRGIFPLLRVSVVDSMLRSNDTRSCSRNRCIVDRGSFRNCSISLIRKIAKISRTRDAKWTAGFFL